MHTVYGAQRVQNLNCAIYYCTVALPGMKPNCANPISTVVSFIINVYTRPG
jgi:hypothetical protein